MVSRGPIYTLACWLWLTLFSLMSLFSGAFVLCSDTFGSRLELGCAKTDTGQCLITTATTTSKISSNMVSAFDIQNPCIETPVSVHLNATPVSASADTNIQLPPPFLIATLISLTTLAEPVQSRPQYGELQRPPDAVEMLGSIVLQV